ncbi:pentulose/hexulose kinase [Thioflavicoccus mobilis 8321]|uniref:Pentulose/hexulose kinase n=1 Tax=Thioflavicoccus mobilis 8321 TaxID=765912 RepID=L0H3U0_9GAMM|nr:FGGY-family carbohydrate kinase [Thioflavicoccus mobilis]AGA92259.1 pentulose/hexulose kinase [Thioflavicoccus mobilis 8321]
MGGAPAPSTGGSVVRSALPCWIGLDVGTSACRAVAIDAEARELANARVALPAPQVRPDGGVEQAPDLWWNAAVTALARLGEALAGRRSVAVCVAATSATLLLADRNGVPLGPALLYNDRRARAAAARIAAVAPPTSPARGVTSGLAKALHLKASLPIGTEAWVLHQADWLAARLGGALGYSDWNNALKLGFDPAAERWPDWFEALDLAPLRLPEVVAPGTPLGRVDRATAAATGLAVGTRVVAGTTDSTAAVIATGVAEPGEGVTCLGSTLVVKVLAERRIDEPACGVYSHRLGDLWLAGGASNSGGVVLRRFFDDADLARLSAQLVPERPSGLDYYPLPGPGERFPLADPDLLPRLTPRPEDDVLFLQGLLEGIAAIERAGYRRLHVLGAPAPTVVTTIGGGAGNAAWTRIRARELGIPVRPAAHREAAYGAALLARRAG